jgi:hypothetical protein
MHFASAIFSDLGIWKDIKSLMMLEPQIGVTKMLSGEKGEYDSNFSIAIDFQCSGKGWP